MMLGRLNPNRNGSSLLSKRFALGLRQNDDYRRAIHDT
jgi:hypothetical protein